MQARSPLALVALGASFLGGMAGGTAHSQVRFPSGTSASRDYVTINVFDSMLDFDRLEDSLFKALPQVYPNKNAQQFLSETLAARDLTLNELWVEVDRVDRQ